MNDQKSKAVKVKAHHHRRRHSSKETHGKKEKEDKLRRRKQVKDKVKKVAKVKTSKESDDGSSGTLFTPIKKSSELASPKKAQVLEVKAGLGQPERAQLKKKLQLINKCLACLKKQKGKVMQQLGALDDGDAVDMDDDVN